ncbi:MAG: 2-amino-4-hydroxy-6-hydroxymethyldihydropteridine diphosphokinase [Pirellulales bacterium]|nr:2-amino-4-hydroxy-6-hydroxymethyldihydropteridine diphosphokinase [Pirellulales bacterium]
MSRALISLGSNLGDREQILSGACAKLGGCPNIELLDVSRFQETLPVGGPSGQGDFLNAAATLETSLTPIELLSALQEIENRFGRVRKTRWDARSLDLDLLLYTDQKISTPDLIVPHPRMTFRRFVLEPAAEIAADWCLPDSNWTVGMLLANINRRPLTLGVAGGTTKQTVVLVEKLAAIREDLQVISIEQRESAAADPPALLVLLDESVSPFVDPPALLRLDTNDWQNVEAEATAAVLAM